jgi:surface antigen Omp85-like protein
VTSRYAGTGLALGRDVVIFDQLEITRGAGLTSDLYAFDRRTGRTRRLTQGARLVDPDLSPDGTRLAVVQTGPAHRELLIVDASALLKAPAPVGMSALPVVSRRGDASDVFASPRWSPDGMQIAAEHRAIGGTSELVILDDHLRSSRTVAASIAKAGRMVTPSWAARDTLLFASDLDGGPFAIYQATLTDGTTTLNRVHAPAGGALSPTAIADGRIVYVGYTTTGYDLFVTAPTASVPIAPAASVPTAPAASVPTAPTASVPIAPYSPLPSVLPRGWLPLVEHRDDRWRVGGVATGVDVLGRHAFAVSASWAVTSDHPAAPLVPGARPDWAASYAYTRWQLVPYVAAQDQTSLFQVVNAQNLLVPVAQREQQVDGGAVRSFRRVRWSQSVLAAYHASHVTTTTSQQDDTSNRSGVRGAWTLLTAKRYGYSISPEGGLAAGITGETFRPALGSDGTGEAVTADLRAYLPLGLRHGVVAVRAAGAVSRGDTGTRRLFLLGGDNGNLSLGRFGNDTISLLRGFDDDVFAGTHVALLNVEARVPLGWPERGWGTWPGFLRAVHATAFADIGNAWTSGAQWDDRKTSLGGELAADVVVGFGLPLTWSVGAAWGHDGAGQLPDQRRVYLRVGRSF